MFKVWKSLFSGRGNQASVEKAEIISVESQLSRILHENVTVESRRMDPDENIRAPKGAEISYLDARALEFWDGKRTDYRVPPYYSETAFGRNVEPALTRLLQGKYLQLSGLVKNISLKTVPELKAILSEHELKVSGKKDELIYRLVENLSEYELRELFPIGVYEITEKGRAALTPYSIISANDNHALGFSYYRLLKEREKSPHDSDEVILTKLLSQELQDCYKSNNQTLYQAVVTKTARFMSEIGETERAFDCYILGFFIFSMQVKSHPDWNSGGQSYYLASLLEQCGKNGGYSLSQVIERIKKVLKENHPFGLTTPSNINFATTLFKKSLSV